MAANIAIGILLAFIVSGALERLVPKTGRISGALSGLAFVLLVLWGTYLGGTWWLKRIGLSSSQIVAWFEPASWLPAFAAQASIVHGITALIMALLLPYFLSMRLSKHRQKLTGVSFYLPALIGIMAWTLLATG